MFMASVAPVSVVVCGPLTLTPTVLVSIRSRLLLLVLSVLLPGLVGVLWLIADTVGHERATNERLLRDTARALSLVVDGELERRDTVALVLAQSRWLDAGPDSAPDDLQRFEQLARRSMAGANGWVLVWSPERVLIDSRGAQAHAGPPPPFFDRAPLSVISRGGEGRGSDEAHAMMVEPVVRDGRASLNIGVTMRPQELQRLLDNLALPGDRVSTVIDHLGRVVARHPGGDSFVGRPATADLSAHLAAAREGLFESVSLDGEKVVGYFSTSSRGWTYIIAMPKTQVAGVVSATVLPVVLGGLGLMGLAALGARWVSGGIERPVRMLKASAERLRAGQAVPPLATGIVECDDVARALAEAADAMQRSRSELEHQVAEAVARARQVEQRSAQGQWVETLGRMTGGVAHEFNNVLGVISNSAHLMERHRAAAELQAPLASTRRAVEVGSQLTQHLLRFAGRHPLRPQIVQLARQLPEVQEVLRSVLGRRIEISVHVAADTAPVKVDPGELELALINLALNARDALPAGGELRLAARNGGAEDDVGAPGTMSTTRWVLVTASDDGVGIAPELLPRVFEPFFTTKALGRGTGLGLSQVHGFCIQSGGLARVDSTPGIGTTVSLLLPAAEPLDTLAATAPAAGAGALPLPATTLTTPPATTLQGMRVLLVEDNYELAGTTTALLQSHGAAVQHAGDAAEALRLLAAQAVDVVLSDVMMPGEMNGLALARLLRERDPALAVVLISGYSDSAGSEFTVLRKPCPAHELLAALQMAAPVGRNGPVL